MTTEVNNLKLQFYKSLCDKLTNENIELRKELAYWQYLGKPEEINKCFDTIFDLIASGHIDNDKLVEDVKDDNEDKRFNRLKNFFRRSK